MGGKTVIEKLEANIANATGLPFVYGAQGDINRALDRAPLPCAFAYLINTSAVDDINGICREVLTLAVFFIDKTEVDFESKENEVIIDRMKEYAFKWITANRISDGELHLMRQNSALRVYDEVADACVTGYSLNVTIKEVAGVGRCQM